MLNSNPMHWKLFFTLVAAAVCSFLLIRWLAKTLNAASIIVPQKRREMGFAAIMKPAEPAQAVIAAPPDLARRIFFAALIGRAQETSCPLPRPAAFKSALTLPLHKIFSASIHSAASGQAAAPDPLPPILTGQDGTKKFRFGSLSVNFLRTRQRRSKIQRAHFNPYSPTQNECARTTANTF